MVANNGEGTSSFFVGNQMINDANGCSMTSNENNLKSVPLHIDTKRKNNDVSLSIAANKKKR